MNPVSLFFCALPLAATAPSPGDIQPRPVVEWKRSDGGNGHFYQAVAVDPGLGISWKDADAYAQAHGGYLATIASQSENDFVFALVDDPIFWRPTSSGQNLMGPWLGGSQPAGSPSPAQGWHWVANQGTFTYTNWSPGQPDNSDPGEEALEFYSLHAPARSPQWNDTSAGNPKKGFIIEFDTNPNVAAPASPTVSTGNATPLLLPLATGTALAVLILLVGLFVFLSRRSRKNEKVPPLLD